MIAREHAPLNKVHRSLQWFCRLEQQRTLGGSHACHGICLGFALEEKKDYGGSTMTLKQVQHQLVQLEEAEEEEDRCQSLSCGP